MAKTAQTQNVGRWRRRLGAGAVVLLCLGLIGAVLGRFYALPRAQSALTQALHEAGYPAGDVQLVPQAWGGLAVIARDTPAAEPFARATLWPWSFSTLRLTDVVVRYVPASGNAGSSGPWWAHPLQLPFLPYKTIVANDVTVGPLHLDLTAMRQSGGNWRADLAFDLPSQQVAGRAQVAVLPDGRYTVTGSAEKSVKAGGPLAVSLALDAGRDDPLFTGMLTGFGIALALNPDRRAGAQDLPFTATFSSFPDLHVAGTMDVATQRASFTVTGGLQTPAVAVTDLKAQVANVAIWPPVVPDGQRVTVGRVQAGGFPLEQVQATFGYRDGALRIQHAEAAALGGRIRVAPFATAWPPESFDATVALENVDLGQALVLAAVDGLGGVGRLSGQVPLHYASGKVSFGEGRLTALEAGSLAYRPATPPAFLAEGGQGALLAQVFSDFRYTALALRLEGTPGDTLTLGARIEGSNPSFYGGHPVSFNLTLSGDLDTVLQQGLKGLRLSSGALHDLIQQGGQP